MLLYNRRKQPTRFHPPIEISDLDFPVFAGRPWQSPLTETEPTNVLSLYKLIRKRSPSPRPFNIFKKNKEQTPGWNTIYKQTGYGDHKHIFLASCKFFALRQATYGGRRGIKICTVFIICTYLF